MSTALERATEAILQAMAVNEHRNFGDAARDLAQAALDAAAAVDTDPPSRLSDFDAGHCETCDGGGYYDVGYADGYREGHEDGSNDLKGTGIQPEPVRVCGPYCGCNDTEEQTDD